MKKCFFVFALALIILISGCVTEPVVVMAYVKGERIIITALQIVKRL